MYCINCGVKLAQSEQKCPLCNTLIYHPDYKDLPTNPLYPSNKMPKIHSGYKALSGALIILFLIPLFISFFSDIHGDGTLDWFGYVAGGVVVAYVTFALPLWFRRPNPVIFVPCDFLAVGLYLLYINWATGGHWFLRFALPVLGGLCLIICAVVTLVHYISKGRLYIYGGGFILFGGLIMLMEFLMKVAFGIHFIGWSIYPLVVFVLLGSVLIYVAINSVAREVLERKLFF